MSAIDEILHQIPLQQLSQEVGADPQETEAALRQIVPQLIGTMQQNAVDPSGEQSLATALSDHAGRGLLDGGLDLAQIDTADGDKITQHVFGADPAVAAAGMPTGGISSALIRKLLPIIAPIVLSYLAKQMQSGKYGDVLGQVLGGMLGGGQQQTQTQAPQQGGLGGGILSDVLGQILGGGQSSPADAGVTTGGSPFDPAPTQQTTVPEGRADGGLRMDDGMGNQVTSDRAAQQQSQDKGNGGGLMDVLGNLLGGKK